MHARLANFAFLAAACLTLCACGKIEPKGVAEDAAAARSAEQARARQMKAACSSRTTYGRLKQIVFDEAIRRGTANAANLDILSTHSLARVEDPMVKGREDALEVTLCAGRLVLTIPPGAERAFGGRRSLAANIEYAGQAAADGSGLVYRMTGAEPLIAELVGFNLNAAAYRPPAPPSPQPTFAPAAPRPTAATVPQAPPPPPPVARTSAPANAAVRPSFNCRYARALAEKLVCADANLASLDRQMSAQFYAALGAADAQERSALRRSRDRFLAARNRCSSEACVAETSVARMEEIDRITGR